MKQSTYTAISKRIGHEGGTMLLPSVQIALELLNQVYKANESAFETVFRYYRFGRTPETEAERESLELITLAYKKGKAIYSVKL